jgi:hypothetical protein
MALIVRIDGTKEEIAGNGGASCITAEQIKEVIGGGFFQVVPCDPAATGGYNHFYCDEEGKLKGFAFNREATRMSTLTASDDNIVGDVLFCKDHPTQPCESA